MTGEQKPGGLEVVASWDDLKALLDRAEARATAAEAKLARAVEGLEHAGRVLDNASVSNALRMVGAFDILSKTLSDLQIRAEL